MRRGPVSSARWDKNGPPPWCHFSVCAPNPNDNGALWHLHMQTASRQSHAMLKGATPCDGTCKGWFALKHDVPKLQFLQQLDTCGDEVP